MGLTGLLKRLLGGAAPAALRTRLSEAEAIALARQAAADHWLRDKLTVATTQRSPSGTLVWSVETGGVGAHLRVLIDDASGAVLEQSAVEGR